MYLDLGGTRVKRLAQATATRAVDELDHALNRTDGVDEAEARFMVVTCSAFVNFLIVRAEAAGLLKR
jgi:hypothetical protein